MEFFWQIVQTIRQLTDPDALRALANFGGLWWFKYVLIFGIVFAETGLLIGFCLPGDSLLFVVGFLAGADVFNLPATLLVLSVAAIFGDAVNFQLGALSGNRVWEKGKYRDHLQKAKDFYDRHGVMSIVLARFVPIVRTFTPFVAGLARMNYSSFVFYNVAGGIGWVLSMTMAGYFLGALEVVKKNFEAVVVGIIVVSVLPMAVEGWRHWRQRRQAAPPASASDPEIPSAR